MQSRKSREAFFHRFYRATLLSALLFASSPAMPSPRLIAPPAPPGDAVLAYVRFDEPSIALRNVHLIDGTGAKARSHVTILVESGRISAIGPSDMSVPGNFRVVDLSGHTALPGLIGMHNHLFYIARPGYAADGSSKPPQLIPQMTFSAPRLYLANGVTTIRTAGSVEPYAELNLKRRIDAGELPGPRLDVTAPYIGNNPRFIQMRELADAEDARRLVAYWANEGATSFKAYTHITGAELGAAIEEAHRHGLKVTGHLCSVTYPEAAALGIDNLEHGFYPNTQLQPGKPPDTCVEAPGGLDLLNMTPSGPAAKQLIELLVSRGVAITSTLPVFEQFLPGRPLPASGALAAMSAQAREAYLYSRNLLNSAPRDSFAAAEQGFRTDMALQRQFVAAGGLLIAGPDPTGNGGVVPGFGDLRGIELLVEAGFSPEEAIRIATLNGAIYLEVADQLGSIEVGKIADLVVVDGNPAADISQIRQVEWVFKDGIGYDPASLLESVKGTYGLY
jgi:imidazolonepropionase-like amidohydrolase